MAAALVAAAAHEDRHAVQPEGNGTVLGAVFDRDGCLDGLAADAGDDLRGSSIRDGLQGEAVKQGDLRISDFEVADVRHILGRSVLEGGQHHDAVEVALGFERVAPRENLQLLERGEFLLKFGQGLALLVCLVLEDEALGPLRTFGDPALQHVDLFGAQRIPLRRHDVVMVSGQDDTLDDLAVIWLSCHQPGAGVAAFEQRCGGVHQQLAFYLIGIVALEASGLEDRLHVADKIHSRCGCRRSTSLCRRRSRHGRRSERSEGEEEERSSQGAFHGCLLGGVGGGYACAHMDLSKV